jgi:hypothetical protein
LGLLLGPENLHPVHLTTQAGPRESLQRNAERQ